MSHIFISYSRQDIDFARYIRALFEAQGFPVWMDEARLNAGMDWWDEIENNIDSCSAFVVIMSPDSRQSVFVRNEILRALDQKRALFPVLLRGDHFGMLAHVHYEEMTSGLNSKLSPKFISNLRNALGLTTKRTVRVNVEHGLIQDTDGDAVLVKLAGGAGLEGLVKKLVGRTDTTLDKEALNPVGGYQLINMQGQMKVKHALFIKTEWLGSFGYRQVRTFAERGLSVLGTDLPECKHLLMTIHGVNTRLRLDESESMQAQLAGLIDVLQAWQAPRDLERITIVEMQSDRVQRLQASLETFFDDVEYAQRAEDTNWGYDLTFERAQTIETPDAGTDHSKRYGLAILPDNPELEDIFYYGVERPVHATGLLCERLSPDPDPDIDPADYLQLALDRIKGASVVVCDISQMSPLLYLQLGYAWGAGIPTALITSNGQPTEFTPQYLIEYTKIWQLEEQLGQWLREKSP